MLSPVTDAAKKLRRLYNDVRDSVAVHEFGSELPKILVGTHHKTGTVWLRRVFRRVSDAFDLKFFNCEQDELPPDFNIYFRNHSHFRLNEFAFDYRGVHIIRDPRDRIVSGCFYHQKAKEAWLHEKRDEFGGLTYQEKLNSYSSEEDRLLFEMEHSGASAINEMLSWDYDNPSFFEVKYEDLIRDEELLLFHQIFAFLGFPGIAMPKLLQIAYQNSLFSGKVKSSVHVRSGNASQWEKHFTEQHRIRFMELYPDALARLGYEVNDDWVRS